jgi:hypothetical protein
MPDAIRSDVVLKPVAATVAQPAVTLPALPSEKISRMLRSLSSNWNALPAYGTRSFAPLFMLWFSPWEICFTLAIASVLWIPFRAHFISVRLAFLVSLLNNLLVCVAANATVAAGFFLAGAHLEALIALLWPVVAGLISYACPQNRTEIIEEKLWRRLRRGAYVPSVACSAAPVA